MNLPPPMEGRRCPSPPLSYHAHQELRKIYKQKQQLLHTQNEAALRKNDETLYQKKLALRDVKTDNPRYIATAQRVVLVKGGEQDIIRIKLKKDRQDLFRVARQTSMVEEEEYLSEDNLSFDDSEQQSQVSAIDSLSISEDLSSESTEELINDEEAADEVCSLANSLEGMTIGAAVIEEDASEDEQDTADVQRFMSCASEKTSQGALMRLYQNQHHLRYQGYGILSSVTTEDLVPLFRID